LSYSSSERETVIRSDDESKIWRIGTFQKRVISKLERIGVKPIEITKDGEHIYEIDFEQVSFRKKIKLSEEQKRARAERLAKGRKKNR
jgi:hypothetical protein